MVVLLVITLALYCALAEQPPPYAASGWRPEGPAFELPNFQTNVQFNQRQEKPQHAYGSSPLLQNPTSTYGVAEIRANRAKIDQNQKQLSYKEYIEKQNRLQNNEHFLQMLPKMHVEEQFTNNGAQEYIEKQRIFQHQSNPLSQPLNLTPTPRGNQRELSESKDIPIQYLPTQNQTFDIRRGGQSTQISRTPEDYLQTNENDSSKKKVAMQPNFRTELIPDFPTYNPNITHIEDRGNFNRDTFRSKNNAKQLQFSNSNIEITTQNGYDGVYKTIMLDDDLQAKIDDVFGKRVVARKTVVRRNRKPVSGRRIPSEQNISSDRLDPNI